MKRIAATATWQDGWWSVTTRMGAREIWTQCRRLDQVPAVVCEAVRMSGGRAIGAPHVEVEVMLDPAVGSLVDATLEASEAASRAQASASAQSRRAVRQLREHGFTVRDCAELLGVSPARISQLLAH